MNTKCKKAYVSPAILRQMALAPRVELLGGSVVEDMRVTSAGHEIAGSFDFNADGFNHEWE